MNKSGHSSIELWRMGWSSPVVWSQSDVNPPCSECGQPLKYRDTYRINDRDEYEIPGELVGRNHPVVSPKRAHDICLMEGVPSQ